MSVAGRQNKPFFEQNLSKPSCKPPSPFSVQSSTKELEKDKKLEPNNACSIRSATEAVVICFLSQDFLLLSGYLYFYFV